MNDTYTHYSNLRLIKDPETREVAGKTLVKITVAANTYGDSAKKRYIAAKFIEATFSGREGEKAAGLRKGDTVSFHGCEEVRTYQKKDGGVGLSFEVQYANALRTPRPSEPAAFEATLPPGLPPGDEHPFDFGA